MYPKLNPNVSFNFRYSEEKTSHSSILALGRPAFLWGGFISTLIPILKDFRLKCGIQDYEKVASKYNFLFNSEVESDFDILAFRAYEFGFEVRRALSCIIYVDSVDTTIEIQSLLNAIDLLVLALETKFSMRKDL